jgi:hypothetical protein
VFLETTMQFLLKYINRALDALTASFCEGTAQ